MQAFEKLEVEWAKWNDLDPQGMVCCSSGTAALHLSLESLQLPQGSEVLTNDFSMIACARAITLAGLTPVFVDCDERLLMSLRLLFETGMRDPGEAIIDCDNWIPPNDSAILAVHVYGRQMDMGQVTSFARMGCSYVIEDLAEAHGVRPHPSTDAACWSFYRNKQTAGEEGGAVWFRDPKHAVLARQLRSLGFTEAHDFRHVPRGHNYRLANCLAEKVLDSLARFGGNIGRRWEIEKWYDASCPAEWKMPKRDAVWVYDVRIKELGRRKMGEVVAALNKEGIAARHSFWPLHLQEECQGKVKMISAWKGEACESSRASEEVFYLPVQPGKTTEEDCKRAFDIIRRIVGEGAIRGQ